ncbi:MAG: oligoendopeptidase F, partial [Candidatus Zixiibacteriota bacterium]
NRRHGIKRGKVMLLRRNPLSAIGLSGLTLIVMFFAFSNISAEEMTLNRDSIPDQYKWNFSHIYLDWKTWERDLASFDSLVDQFGTFQGSLADSPDNLLRVLRFRDRIDKLYDSVSSYVGLQYAVDVKNNDMNGKYQRVQAIGKKYRIAQSWLSPELLNINRDILNTWLSAKPALREYRMEIENLFRRQEHTLDAAQEQLLSYFSSFQGSPVRTYDALTTADVKYPTITTSDGQEVKLTEGRYMNLIMTDRNQEDRKTAFESTMTIYSTNRNTYASIYGAVLERDWATAQARKYATTLDSYLDRDNVPTEVFTNLIETVMKGSGAIRRYFNLKKEYLGIDSFHMYDRYVPIIDFDKKYKYNDIKEWITASTAPLGVEYQSALRDGFDDRWIDVYENDGKSTGGFCSGVYGVHPYILVNYNETISEMFTVAHEMGHAMHSVLSEESQPYPTSGHSIFVAEVASTGGEQLLLRYLLENCPDPKERIYLLQYTIDDLYKTFYRQVLFADFEWRAHQKVEKSEPITAQSLNELYLQVIKDFYGDAMAGDSLLGYYWATVPHFFFGPYYVYKYATSYAASTRLISDIMSSTGEARTAAINRYLNLLKAGNSDFPMDLLEQAGVNMADPNTYQAIIELTDALVTQLETELKKLP